MSVGTIILIILVIVLLGGFSGLGGGPFYGTGYYGGGGLGLVIVILLILDPDGKTLGRYFTAAVPIIARAARTVSARQPISFCISALSAPVPLRQRR